MEHQTYKQPDEALKKPNYMITVIVVSVIIMVYQGIANSDLGVLSQLTHQKGNDWAGPLSTALLFIGSGVGSLYNKYIGKYSFKTLFFIGSFGYTLFISTGLIFVKIGFTNLVQVLIFIGSFISGLIVSIFYNTQFNYINLLSKIDNQSVKYFGINMGMVQSSNLFGNFLSWLLIKPLGQFFYLLVMDIIVFLTSFGYFFTVKQPLKKEIQSIGGYGSNQDNDNDDGQMQGEKDINIRINNSVHQQLSQHLCGPCFAFTGIIVAFVYTGLSIIIYRTFQNKMSDVELNKLTFNVFIFEGVGQLLGGLTMMFFEHKIKDTAKTYMMISTVFMIFVGVIYIGCLNQSYLVLCLGVIVIGYCDCVSMIVALSLAGNWKEKGITAYNIWQCLAVASSVMFMVFVAFEVLFIWNTVFYFVCIISLFSYRMKKKNLILKEQKQSLIEEDRSSQRQDHKDTL